MAEKPRFIHRRSETVNGWLATRKAVATMQAKEVPVGKLQGWQLHKPQGEVVFDIRNPDAQGNPRFHKGVGRSVSASGREVDSYGVFGLEEVPDPSDPAGAVGTAGLLVDKRTGNILVQTAAEPFNAPPGSKPGDYLSIRASVQGSYSNISENKVPFSDQVNPKTYTSLVTLNPSRTSGKVRVGITYVDGKKIDLKEKPNYQWFSRRQLDKALRDDINAFNGFFHAAYGVYKAKHRFSNRLRSAS